MNMSSDRRLRAGIRALPVVLSAVAMLAALLPTTSSAATNESATLDQCTNGQVSPLTPQPCVGSNISAVTVAIQGINSGNAAAYKNWVNGNANGSKAHWRESEFISYRTILSGLPAGAHTMTFDYDTVHSGRHALDYLGSYDATETTDPTTTSASGKIIHANNNSPCADLVAAGEMDQSQCGTAYDSSTHAQTSPAAPAASVAAPHENFGSGAGGETGCGSAPGTFSGTQTPGSIKFFGPIDTSFTPTATILSDNVPSGTGQCTTAVTVAWKTSSALDANHDMVIAWGGHISSQGDWGVGNSASFISGSPFHMSLISLDGASTGSQDRALATSAIFFTPAIATCIDGTTVCTASINIGTSAFDTATLTGAAATAGGTVTYTVYSENTCTTKATTGTTGQINHQPGAAAATPDTPGTVTVTNGVVPNSGSVTFQAAGTYYWQATYSGDSIDIGPVSSACTSEPLVVGKASPSISTSINGNATTTGKIGDSVYDTATLTGATTNAGGTVTYTVYSENTCTTKATTGTTGQINQQPGAAAATPGTPGTVTVSGGVVPKSGSVTFQAAGTYYWQAYYSGDSNNDSATSSCSSEQLVISKNSPTIATSIDGNATTKGNIGDSVYDTATLSGATGNAGGTVTYTVYQNNTCTTKASTGTTGQINQQPGAAAATPDTPGTVTVSSGVVPASGSVTFQAAGTFYWQAVYSGDSNNKSATSSCTSETIAISPNSPTIATSVEGDATATGNIGDSVYDTASLTGATSNAGGTVTYTVYSEDTCTTKATTGTTGQISQQPGAAAATPDTPGTVTVSSGVVPNSGSVTFQTAGTFYWQAVYSGDSNNDGATSTCTSEELVIGKNAPTIATTLSESSGAIGDSVHDSSTLTGATSNAGGTVTYTVYSEKTCTTKATTGTTGQINQQPGAAAATPDTPGTVTVTNGSVPDSGDVTFQDAGTYYWQAVYSGDSNNDGATSTCTSEELVINPNQSAISTAQNLLPNDSATITGATSDAGGTVTFNLFDPKDSTCSGTPALTQTVNVSGNGTYSTTNTSYTVTTTGEWRWQVVYSGDSNNVGSSSACGVENFTITNG